MTMKLDAIPYNQSISVTLSELPGLAARVAQELSREKEPFVLWLIGDLGAGKTTFTRELLRALGLSEVIPVLSPTYTYLTEYNINERCYAHMDLYRLAEGDEDSVEALLAGRPYAGIIVEWPERANSSPFLQKTHQVTMAFGASDNERLMTVAKFVVSP